MFTKENNPPDPAQHRSDSGRDAAGIDCLPGETVITPARRRNRWQQLEQAMCSWPARVISVLAAVFTLSIWTGGSVGAPSRALIVMLVLAGALTLTTRRGWRLLRRCLRPQHVVRTVGTTAAVVFALLILQVVLAGPLAGADLAVSRLAAGVSHGLLYQVASLISVIAQVGVQAGALLILGAALARRARRRRPLLLAGSAVVLVGVTVGAGKLLLGRARPTANVQALHVGGSSFPSGHTCTAVVLGGVAAWLIGRGAHQLVRRLWQVLAGVWAVAVGVDRLYLNVHWLTDVLAGWALGITLLCLLIAADRYLNGTTAGQSDRKRSDARWSERNLESAVEPAC